MCKQLKMTELRVVKKNGKLEKFDQQKIVKSCTAAGASRRAARIIADQVREKVYDKVPTSEVRDLTVKALEQYNPEWAENWREYEKSK